jgi:hypothetical protein
MAVGYAAQYDPPNHLSPQLESLLDVLLQDYNPKVRDYVLELTVPMTIAWHVRQLEGFLRTKVYPEDDLMHSVAFGIAMAFSLEPQEIWNLLGRWLAELQREAPQPPESVSVRERWISTLALSYGYLQLEGEGLAITSRQILSRLQAVLAEEEHWFVRRNTLLGIGLQAIRNFDLVAPLLDQLVSEITLTDRAFLVSVFRQAYLRQREQMADGEGQIQVEGRSYPIWTQSSRPLTRLELLLFDWIESGDPVARQIAVQTFAALEATELERLERWAASSLGSGMGGSRARGKETPIWKLPRVRKLGLLGHMAVYLADPRDWRRRAALQPLLAEMIEMGRRKKSPMGYIDLHPQHELGELKQGDGSALPLKGGAARNSFRYSVLPGSWTLLRRWSASSEKSVRSLTSALKRAVFLYRWRWVVVATGTYFTILISIVIYGWAMNATAEADRLIQVLKAKLTSESAPVENQAVPAKNQVQGGRS